MITMITIVPKPINMELLLLFTPSRKRSCWRLAGHGPVNWVFDCGFCGDRRPAGPAWPGWPEYPGLVGAAARGGPGVAHTKRDSRSDWCCHTPPRLACAQGAAEVQSSRSRKSRMHASTPSATFPINNATPDLPGSQTLRQNLPGP